MTPRDIILLRIQKIKDIRLSFAAIVTEQILDELREHGYTITEATKAGASRTDDEKRACYGRCSAGDCSR